MRKTLLIAAATLAAGVIAAQADSPVYSQNIVGYYNVPVPAGKFVIVGNQLNLDGTNSINNIFTGLVSDPNAQANTVIWTWNTSISQYSSYQYFTGADADNNFLLSGSVNGFYDNSGDLINANLPVGKAAFLQNPSGSAITATMVGTVSQGTNVITLQQGYNLITSPIPVSTNLTSSVLGFVGTSDPNAVNNDVVWTWNPNISQYSAYQYFTGADADNNFLLSGSVNGFYDNSGDLITVAPTVGNGFFIQHVVSGSTTWTNIFQAQ
jgi:hypothetical protein